MKIAYHYDPETLLYIGTSEVHKVAGYDDYMLPQLATWSEVPDFDQQTQQLKFQPREQDWKAEIKPISVEAYLKSDPTQSKVFDDKSLVTDEYTLKKPRTQFDEWIDDEWITNESDKYIAEYAQVNAARAALYKELVDPLENEYSRKKRQGHEEEAQMLSERIDELEAKIRAENPYPVNPNKDKTEEDN